MVNTRIIKIKKMKEYQTVNPFLASYHVGESTSRGLVFWHSFGTLALARSYASQWSKHNNAWTLVEEL